MNDSNNTAAPQQPTKGKEPSHDVYQVNGQGKNAQWHKIGSVWQGDNDSLSGDTVHGRLVLRSREALKEMREQKSQQQGQNQSQNPSM